MIVGTGVDILEISRVERALERTPGFAERILTSNELETFNHSSQPARFLAKRFAAKEAAVKALGTGIAKGVSWQHLEVTKNSAGRPSLLVTGKALEHSNSQGITQWFLSYSDEQYYVVAQVIAQA